VDERSAESGDGFWTQTIMKIPPDLIITLWPIYNVPWNLHANSFSGICITSTN